MTPGAYSVIRSIPDPIRGEAFNVGLIAWNDEMCRITLDEEAAQRAVNRSPFLAKDAWVHYESFLRDLLVRDGKVDRAALERFIHEPTGETLRLTKPAYVRTSDGQAAFEHRLSEILKRLVSPVHRGGGGTHNPVSELRSLLRRSIANELVKANHPFRDTRSGVARTCHFFANSGANVAVDALQLALSKASDAHERIDAEATRVADVLAANRVKYVVYCRLPEGELFSNIEERAERVLTFAGARMVTKPADAADILETAVERPQSTLF